MGRGERRDMYSTGMDVNSARRLDMTLEDERQKKIWLVDMWCPQEKNIEEVTQTKLRKYQQLAFEIMERRP